MTNVQKKDIIFNVNKGYIVSYCIPQNVFYNETNPFKGQGEFLWRKDGRMIDCTYFPLDNPIKIADYISNFLSLQGNKYGPFAINRRIKEGYLFYCTDQLANYINSLI